METNESTPIENFIEEISKARFFTTLTPNKNSKDRYNAQISFTNYVELLFTVRDLLKISLHTLYNNDLENSGSVEDPGFHVVSVLEIAVQLLPCNEAEALHECHKLFLKLEKEKSAKEKNDYGRK